MSTAIFNINYVGNGRILGPSTVAFLTNPFLDADFSISGFVDDDVVINGVVYQPGAFPYNGTSSNGAHNFIFTSGSVPFGATISIGVNNNFPSNTWLVATGVFTYVDTPCPNEVVIPPPVYPPYTPPAFLGPYAFSFSISNPSSVPFIDDVIVTTSVSGAVTGTTQDLYFNVGNGDVGITEKIGLASTGVYY